MVVDDYPAINRMFVRQLQAAGYTAEGFSTGGAAMAHLERAPAHLAILDVTLSGWDTYPHGCALARAMRERWPDLRLIFVSGYASKEIRAICPPDLPVLTKPVMNSSAFVAYVAEVLAAPPWTPRTWSPPWT